MRKSPKCFAYRTNACTRTRRNITGGSAGTGGSGKTREHKEGWTEGPILFLTGSVFFSEMAENRDAENDLDQQDRAQHQDGKPAVPDHPGSVQHGENHHRD